MEENMHSNRTHKDQIKSPEHRKQRFSLRKFSFGAASILVGSLLFFGQSVSADEALTVSDATTAQGLSATLEESAPTEEVVTSSAPVSEEVNPAATELETKADETSLVEAKAEEVVAKTEEVASTATQDATTDVKVEEVSQPKYATKEYKATNTAPKDLSNNAMPRPSDEGTVLTEKTGFRASGAEVLPDGYSVADFNLSEDLKKYQDPEKNRMVSNIIENQNEDYMYTVSIDSETKKWYIVEFSKDGQKLRESPLLPDTPIKLLNGKSQAILLTSGLGSVQVGKDPDYLGDERVYFKGRFNVGYATRTPANKTLTYSSQTAGETSTKVSHIDRLTGGGPKGSYYPKRFYR